MSDQGTKPPAGGFINAPQQKKDFSLDPPEGYPTGGAPSPQTMESFKQLDNARKEAIQKQERDKKAEEEEKPPEEKSELQTDVETPDLDFDVFGLDPERRKLLASLVGPEQKALAAELSGPIKLGDLLHFGEFRQWVTIAQKVDDDPGLEVEFRSMSSAEDVMIQEFVQKFEDMPLLTAQTLQQLCILACCIREVRGLGLRDVPDGLMRCKSTFFDSKVDMVADAGGLVERDLMDNEVLVIGLYPAGYRGDFGCEVRQIHRRPPGGSAEKSNFLSGRGI